MKTLQADKVTPRSLRAVARAGEELVIFDGDEPIARVVPMSVEVTKRAQHFMYWPHDPADCLRTCWRHPAQVRELEAVDG